MRQVQVRTDWPALLFSSLAQLSFAAWLVWLALWPEGEHGEVISHTLMLLAPFDYVRTALYSRLSVAHREYAGRRWPPVKNFLGTVAFFAGFVLLSTTIPGRHDHGPLENAAALTRPWVYLAFLVPVALMVAENATSLFGVQGSSRRQAARLEAAAADSSEWLFVGIVLGGFALLCVILTATTTHAMKEFFLLYAAAYFATKSIVLANVYTARFALTGQRVLAAAWFIRLINGKKHFETKLLEEQQASDRRRAAMLGEDSA